MVVVVGVVVEGEGLWVAAVGDGVVMGVMGVGVEGGREYQIFTMVIF